MREMTKKTVRGGEKMRKKGWNGYRRIERTV